MSDRDLLALFESSRVIRVITHVVARATTLRQSSVILAKAQTAATAWSKLQWWQRRRAGGVMLVTMAMTHLVLRTWRHEPGWQSLIIPTMIATAGVLLLLVSRQPNRTVS